MAVWRNKKERFIYYASRQMSPTEKNYTTTNKECLPIIYACKKFRHYLLGYDVVFHTDHDAIKYLVNKTDLSGRIARWVMLLQEFQYQIKVKPDVGNKNVDYLSRLEEGIVNQSLTADFPDEHLFAITVE
jgi:RNase H-like domain found in reverse transcriptase